jgi:hypothetical protein
VIRVRYEQNRNGGGSSGSAATFPTAKIGVCQLHHGSNQMVAPNRRKIAPRARKTLKYQAATRYAFVFADGSMTQVGGQRCRI